MRDLKKIVARFSGDRNGNYATILSVLSVPLLIAAAMTVEFSGSIGAKSGLQNAVDSAALAAAAAPNNMSDADLQALVASFVESNGGRATVKRVKGRKLNSEKITVEVSAEAIVKNDFAVLRSGEALAISAKAIAERVTKTPEIAVVLDVTAQIGMGASWKNNAAVIETIIEKLRGTAPTSNFSVSLIPFAERVSVEKDVSFDWLTDEAQNFIDNQSQKIRCSCGNMHYPWDNPDHCTEQDLQNANISNGYPPPPPGAPNEWKGCLKPREENNGSFSYSVDDKAPLNQSTKFEPTVAHFAMGAALEPNYMCPPAMTLGGTKVKSIRDQIAKLNTSNGTARVEEGLAWGWRSLSPKWQGQWRNPNHPMAVDTTRKIITLFTDGHTQIHQTEYGQPSGNPFGFNNGHPLVFEHMVDLCSRMKADGVEIMVFHTIGNEAAASPLKQCASEGMYHRVETRNGLLTAVKEMPNITSMPRLVR